MPEHDHNLFDDRVRQLLDEPPPPRVRTAFDAHLREFRHSLESLSTARPVVWNRRSLQVAIAAAACGAIVYGILFVLLSRPSQALAWSDVMRNVNHARTVTYWIHQQNRTKENGQWKVLINGAAHVRMRLGEVSRLDAYPNAPVPPGPNARLGRIDVSWKNRGYLERIDFESKTITAYRSFSVNKNRWATRRGNLESLLELLRTIPADKVRRLNRADVIDGVKCSVYEITTEAVSDTTPDFKGHSECLAWVSPATGLPVQFQARIWGENWENTFLFSHFQFDTPIPAEAFAIPADGHDFPMRTYWSIYAPREMLAGKFSLRIAIKDKKPFMTERDFQTQDHKRFELRHEAAFKKFTDDHRGQTIEIRLNGQLLGSYVLDSQVMGVQIFSEEDYL